MGKITDQQLCLLILFILAAGSLIGSSFAKEANQTVMITISASVVSGILGYLKGSGDK